MSAETLHGEYASLKQGSGLMKIYDHGTETVRDGRIQRLGFTTMAGHSYAAILGEPREQTTDITTIATTAWFTSIEGHNEHTARVFMKHGNPILFIGAEGSEHAGSSPLGITLAKSAAAVLRFAQEVSGDTADPINRYLIGESRGAMIGMGIMAMADAFDQRIAFADLTAPCFPRRFHPVHDAVTLAKHALREPRTVIELAGKLPFKLLLHYPATLDLNPHSLVHQLAIGPALFSGEAGDLAGRIPAEQAMHVTTYDDDAASMHKTWVDLFSEYPNVRVTPLAGSHLSLADPQTLRYLVARNRIFQKQCADGGKVDAEAIFNGAHELVID